jgi:hypothetical protein
LPKNDYNQNVRLKGIGIAKAYKTIMDFQSVANFIKQSPHLNMEEKKAYEEIIKCSVMFSKYHDKDFKLSDKIQKKIDDFKIWKPDIIWDLVQDFFAENKISNMFRSQWKKNSPKKTNNENVFIFK